ncbi:MAG TPA: nitroreductase family protein [bacterium]|nr:nitroreductase family protein [bacterium]
MGVYETILKRRTIRRFRPDPVPPELLEKLAEAGRLAPSGGNLQPCEFIIVDQPDRVAELFPALRWAAYVAPAGNPPEGHRPTAYVVVLVNQSIKREGPVDSAAAVMSMILTAQEAGVSSCWLGSIEREKLAEMLGIPGNYHIDSVLALGYPDQKSCVEEYRDSVKYWLDDRGDFHVPKRGLKEILHRNAFGRR